MMVRRETVGTDSPTQRIQTTIYLPRDMHTELRIKALRQHVSMTRLIVRAIQRELSTPSEGAFEVGE